MGKPAKSIQLYAFCEFSHDVDAKPSTEPNNAIFLSTSTTVDRYTSFLEYLRLQMAPGPPRSQLTYQFPGPILDIHKNFLEWCPDDSLAREIDKYISSAGHWKAFAEKGFNLTSNEWMSVAAPLFAAKYLTIRRGLPPIEWGNRGQYHIPEPTRYLVGMFSLAFH